MIKSKRFIFIGILIAAIAAIAVVRLAHKPAEEAMQEVSPVVGNIQTVITATATVQPQNRLEIKPPINGRIEKILVTKE